MTGVLDEALLVLDGAGQPAEHVVEGPAEPGDLVAPGHRDRDVQPAVLRHALGDRGQPHQPAGDPARQPPAARTGQRDDRGGQQSGALLERGEQILGLAELLGDLDRPAAATERDGRDVVLLVADVRLPLRVQARPVVVGDPALRGTGRQRRAPPLHDLAAGARICTSVRLGRVRSSRGPSWSGSAVA